VKELPPGEQESFTIPLDKVVAAPKKIWSFFRNKMQQRKEAKEDERNVRQDDSER
jgi:hypothetical protein